LVLEVDLDDPPQPRQDDQDPLLVRKRASGETGARPPGDPWNPGLEARAHALSDLLGRAGEHDRAWRNPILEEPVGLVGPELVRMRDDMLVACDLTQSLDQQVDVHPRPF